MAMSIASDPVILPCGTDLDQVWTRLDRIAAETHMGHCPHCQVAAGSLRTLRQATGQLIAQPPAPPPDLTGRIMAVVRAELRRGRNLPLPTRSHTATISEYALAAVLRYVTDHGGELVARGCKIAPVPDRPGHLRVRLGVTVPYGSDPAPALARLRQRILRAADAHVGLTLDVLDIVVEDVYPTTPGQRADR
ncbi:MAG TPA: Asp23/Gls24 family envelope stress response protein [Jiangellaceae bacterium]